MPTCSPSNCHWILIGVLLCSIFLLFKLVNTFLRGKAIMKLMEVCWKNSFLKEIWKIQTKRTLFFLLHQKINFKCEVIII